MNLKFVLRGTLFALAALVVLLFVAYRTLPDMLFSVPYGPTPRPPTITALRGNMPQEWPGMEAHAEYENADPALAGSGFAFRLPSGAVVAATAAHSYDLAGNLRAVRMSHGINAISLDVLFGDPGTPRGLSRNLSNDYLLLFVESDNEAASVLEPDDRGFPQPGERIVLYPGVGSGNGERWGTVLESSDRAAWAVMDEAFDPGLMSGSPIVSAHTGRVVGMALAAGLREGQTVIGMHPIGSLVEKGLTAVDLIPLVDYRPEE